MNWYCFFYSLEAVNPFSELKIFSEISPVFKYFEENFNLKLKNVFISSAYKYLYGREYFWFLILIMFLVFRK